MLLLEIPPQVCRAGLESPIRVRYVGRVYEKAVCGEFWLQLSIAVEMEKPSQRSTHYLI